MFYKTIFLNILFYIFQANFAKKLAFKKFFDIFIKRFMKTRDITIASFGEIVWDVYPGEKILGGAPLNFAYFCAELGAKAKIISAVGDDELGKEALSLIEKINVDSGCVSICPNAPTGRVDVKMHDNGIPSYHIVSPSSWDFIDSSENTIEAAKNSNAFAYGTLSQRSGESRAALKKILAALPASCLKICDVNLRAPYYTYEIVESSISGADILKINDDELEVLTAVLNLDGGDIQTRAQTILERYNLRHLLLTCGPKGYMVLSANEAPVFGGGGKIKIVDTVGAGDSFTAAFTVNILAGKNVEESARAADTLAEEVCSRRGAINIQ